MTEEKAQRAELYLVGMVCYYGKHYSTFFFQTKIRRWMYFDDAHVKEVCPLPLHNLHPPPVDLIDLGYFHSTRIFTHQLVFNGSEA